MQNILSAQDTMETILTYETKFFQCQMNRKVNMMKVNEIIVIPEGLEFNVIELPEMIGETAPGKCFERYVVYCSVQWLTHLTAPARRHCRKRHSLSLLPSTRIQE